MNILYNYSIRRLNLDTRIIAAAGQMIGQETVQLRQRLESFCRARVK